MPTMLAELDDIGTEAEERTDTVWSEAHVIPAAFEAREASMRRQDRLLLPSGRLVFFEYEDDRPTWLVQSINSLESLLQLRENWNSYRAQPVHEVAVVASLQTLAEVMRDNTPLPAFVPTVSGGIQLEWHLQGLDIEIQVSPDGERWASIEDLRAGTTWESDLATDLEPLYDILLDVTRRQE